MNLVLKHINKNISDHKLRTVIIVLAISVACALVFVALSISDTMVKIYEHSLRKFCGESDIKITYEKEDGDNNGYFSPLDLSAVSSNVNNQVNIILENGFYHQSDINDVIISLIAADIEEYKQVSNIEIKEGNSALKDNELIIGSKLASEYSLKLGDKISIFISGKDVEYTIAGIAEDKGLFFDDGKSIVMFTSLENFSSNYGNEGKINVQYLKLNDSDDLDKVVSSLSDKYGDYEIIEAISKESSQETVKLLTLVFTLVAVVSIMLALYINSVTFKTAIMERLPVLGTFRSLGARKRFVNRIILCEGGLQGLIGGIVGSGLGIVLLKVIVNIVKISWGGADGSVVVYGAANVIITFAAALVIAGLSSYSGIRKIKKYSIKELIFNNNEDKIEKPSFIKFIVCVILLAFTQIVPRFVTGMAAAAIDGISIVLLIALIPLMTPYFVRLFVDIVSFIGSKLNAPSLNVAAKNLKDDKNVRSNMVMIAIGAACLLMISTVGNDVIKATIDTFGDTEYQITFSDMEPNDQTETKIRETSGVTEFCGIYEQLNVKVDGSSTSISYLDGVNPDNFKEYFKMRYYNEDEDAVLKLKESGGIILNRTFRGLLGVEIGDKVTLEAGKDRKAEYTVVAFMDTLWVGGSYAMISADDMKKDFDREYYDAYWIKTSIDADEGVKALQQTFWDSTITISTTRSVRDNIVNANSIMFKVVDVFSVIAIIICIVGCFNNVLLSFFKRRKTFALYRSLGMSKEQLKRMSFIEALCTGLFGGILGVLFGNLLIKGTSLILSEMMATIDMTYSVKTGALYILITVVIMIVSSISGMVKSANTNIIETLKCE